MTSSCWQDKILSYITVTIASFPKHMPSHLHICFTWLQHLYSIPIPFKHSDEPVTFLMRLPISNLRREALYISSSQVETPGLVVTELCEHFLKKLASITFPEVSLNLLAGCQRQHPEWALRQSQSRCNMKFKECCPILAGQWTFAKLRVVKHIKNPAGSHFRTCQAWMALD